jgi:hypothetical protein
MRAHRHPWALRGLAVVGILTAPAAFAPGATSLPVPALLSQPGLYADIATQTVAEDHLPYAPQYPLWSDGATKRRWIYLPPGTAIDASDPDHWIFPIGTHLFKEFSLGTRVESRDPLCFDEWDEAYLQILASQIAMGIDRLQADEEDAPAALEALPAVPSRTSPHPPLQILYYRCDDCVFVDGEYLIRNVPARILWKVLTSHRDESRTEFTNRELRLDPSLGLPPIKDNLESRLILLRKRLAEKCPALKLVPVKRGRFALELDATFELTEKEHA